MWAETEQVDDEEEEGGDQPPPRDEPKRRVTFNAQVAACTAPGTVAIFLVSRTQS